VALIWIDENGVALFPVVWITTGAAKACPAPNCPPARGQKWVALRDRALNAPKLSRVAVSPERYTFWSLACAAKECL